MDSILNILDVVILTNFIHLNIYADERIQAAIEQIVDGEKRYGQCGNYAY